MRASYVTVVSSVYQTRSNVIHSLTASAVYFTLLQALTTFPILCPIHVRFSDSSISPKSMICASISSLVNNSTGLSLLWIHIYLLLWITFSWIAMLLWLCNGVLKLRAVEIDAMARNVFSDHEVDTTYYPHPHHPFGFTDIPLAGRNHPIRCLRCRAIMMYNLLRTLRIWRHYMTRKAEK